MTAFVFSNILQRAADQNIIPNKTSEARDWFRDTASSVSSVNTQRMLSSGSQRFASRPYPGRMYAFMYEAKHKGTLPYFDKFPLIFPIGPAEGGFLGINLHYLPPIFRARLMDALYDNVTNKKYDDSTRLKISYDILSKASKFRYFKPCVKHYLNTQIRSRFLYIQPQEWDIALFLPTERFQGARKDRVWRDSRQIIFGAS